MMFGKIHEARVERDIFGMPQKKVLEEIKPLSKNELERAREELRAGIQLIMIPAVLVLVVLYFTEKLAWMLDGILNGVATAQSPQIKISL